MWLLGRGRGQAGLGPGGGGRRGVGSTACGPVFGWEAQRSLSAPCPAGSIELLAHSAKRFFMLEGLRISEDLWHLHGISWFA